MRCGNVTASAPGAVQAAFADADAVIVSMLRIVCTQALAASAPFLVMWFVKNETCSSCS